MLLPVSTSIDALPEPRLSVPYYQRPHSENAFTFFRKDEDMSAAILHFGREIDECFPNLRQRGYSVQCSLDGNDLHHGRHGSAVYDLVSSSNLETVKSWNAASTARKHLLVPSILFQTPSAGRNPQTDRQFSEAETSDYDLVIPANKSPEHWIHQLADLIARGRRLRRASERIVANSRKSLSETAKTIARAGPAVGRATSLREHNDVLKPILNLLADRVLMCKSCGEKFVFTAGEQLMCQLRWAMHMPDRCRKCHSDSMTR